MIESDHARATRLQRPTVIPIPIRQARQPGATMLLIHNALEQILGMYK